MAASRPLSSQELRDLSSGRWLVPILAEMAASGGSRFGILVAKLGVSRSVLSRQIDILEQLGWLVRNPGHGHPLRPEYLLSARGREIALAAGNLTEARDRLGVSRKAFNRWTLPLMGEIGPRWTRYSALQRALAPISPRALSLELGSLRAADLVQRQPLEPLYGLTQRGLVLADVVASPS